jgi:hypothetical protein
MDGFVITKPCELEMSYENYLGLIIQSCVHVFICPSSYFKYPLFYFWMET